jgi:K+-sensing histidine kinase KdpD
MEAHQGTINYAKNDGSGTTFFVDLPMFVESTSAADTNSSTASLVIAAE